MNNGFTQQKEFIIFLKLTESVMLIVAMKTESFQFLMDSTNGLILSSPAKLPVPDINTPVSKTESIVGVVMILRHRPASHQHLNAMSNVPETLLTFVEDKQE